MYYRLAARTGRCEGSYTRNRSINRRIRDADAESDAISSREASARRAEDALTGRQIMTTKSQAYRGNIPRYSIFGVDVDALDIMTLHELLDAAVKYERTVLVANHNLHSIYLSRHDLKMKTFYDQADIVFIDGMSIIYWGRFMGHALRQCHRITYVDWIYPLASHCARSAWRVFYLGSRPGVARRGASILRQEFPDLHIATHHGHFDVGSEVNERVLGDIDRFEPHVLVVGMGMPRQEHWILDNFHRLTANAILTSGACMDYVANEIYTPPRWSATVGCEWAFRLASNPKRLARRYLVEPWGLLPVALADLRKSRQ